MSTKLPENVPPEKKKELEELLSDSEVWNGLTKRTAELAADKKKRRAFFISIAVCILIIVGAIYWLFDSIHVGALAAQEHYKNVKESVSSEVYDAFYESSYKFHEQQHHVSNEISITIGSLQEQAKLEVLKISEVDYKTPEEDERNMIETIKKSISGLLFGNVISWLEVPGYGVFTVDLRSSEFIVDNERQYVLVRIPSPELSEFTIDYANVELLNFEDTGIFKNSARVGENIAREQLQSAELSMRQKANSNQDFYQSARESAITIITTLVKQLNPSLPNLSVQVEFFD